MLLAWRGQVIHNRCTRRTTLSPCYNCLRRKQYIVLPFILVFIARKYHFRNNPGWSLLAASPFLLKIKSFLRQSRLLFWNGKHFSQWNISAIRLARISLEKFYQQGRYVLMHQTVSSNEQFIIALSPAEMRKLKLKSKYLHNFLLIIASWDPSNEQL